MAIVRKWGDRVLKALQTPLECGLAHSEIFHHPISGLKPIIFMPNYTLYTLNPEKCTVIFEDYEIKAFGFSKCGNYIAIGTSHTLDVFKKADG